MKKLLLFFITIAFVFALTACRNSTPDKIVVGRWGGNDAETTAFQQMLAEFTAATGIEVEERVYSDYNLELQAELIGGNAPDVFYVDAYMAPFFISQGVLRPLDANEFSLNSFYAPLREAFNQNGQYYSVSKDYSTLALYYNKAMVNPNDIPTTFEELWSGNFLTNLQATLPSGVAAMTVNIDLARNMFIAQSGGLSITTSTGRSNIGSDAIINNLNPQLTAWAEGKLTENSALGTGWNGDAFGQQKTAIMIEGNWVLGFLQQEFPNVDFGVLELPTYQGNKGTMVFTVGYSINAATTNLEGAKEFVKFATGRQGMATWTTGAGVLPSRIDVTTATGVENDPLKQPHIAGAAYATVWQKGTHLDSINLEFRNYAPSILRGERSIAEALRLAESEANKTIDASE